MSRLIDGDALLAEYDRVHVGPPGGARKLIEDAPTVKPKPEWIPISLDGKLPEEEEICLVCGKNGGMCVARFCRRGNILLWTKTGTGKFVYPVAVAGTV